jgi:ring-1,2-phenylacetyl-CoA epoxidase subunit PaaE
MFLEELLALKDLHLSRLSLNFLFTREPQDVELFNGRIDGDKVRQLAGALFAAARR